MNKTFENWGVLSSADNSGSFGAPSSPNEVRVPGGRGGSGSAETLSIQCSGSGSRFMEVAQEQL